MVTVSIVAFLVLMYLYIGMSTWSLVVRTAKKNGDDESTLPTFLKWSSYTIWPWVWLKLFQGALREAKRRAQEVKDKPNTTLEDLRRRNQELQKTADLLDEIDRLKSKIVELNSVAAGQHKSIAFTNEHFRKREEALSELNAGLDKLKRKIAVSSKRESEVN